MHPLDPATTGAFVHMWIDDVHCHGWAQHFEPVDNGAYCDDELPLSAIIVVEGAGDDDRGPRGIISAADYAHIVEPYRHADTAAARVEALRHHACRLQSDLALHFQELRVCALRGQYLPVPVVAAGWLNAVPTSGQWAELEVTEKGVTLESLARAGLLETTLGITAPRWKLSAARFNDTADEFESVAWAPEFERALAQAVAPYVAALQAIGDDPAFTGGAGRPLQTAVEPPCCP